MVTFNLRGRNGGIVNGSWELNNIVHNTTWIPGHFHITVGTASALTFMGVAFWMMPHLTGRRLLSRRLALSAAWLWFGGMSVFAIGMHWAGLHGVPRRAWVSYLPQTVYDRLYGDAHFPLTMVAVGGVGVVARDLLLLRRVPRQPLHATPVHAGADPLHPGLRRRGELLARRRRAHRHPWRTATCRRSPRRWSTSASSRPSRLSPPAARLRADLLALRPQHHARTGLVSLGEGRRPALAAAVGATARARRRAALGFAGVGPGDCGLAGAGPAARLPLALPGTDGRPFDIGAERGRVVLVYFGYTHCPDVCPSTLARPSGMPWAASGPMPGVCASSS